MIRILLVILLPTAAFADSPGDLRALASSYYEWRNSVYPVASSDQGKHTWDDRLTDYRMPAVQERRRHVDEALARVKAMRTDGWSKDDLKRHLFETVRAPYRTLIPDAESGEGTNLRFARGGEPDPDELIPKFPSVDEIHVVVAGGTAGRFSMAIPGWLGTKNGSAPITVPIRNIA